MTRASFVEMVEWNYQYYILFKKVMSNERDGRILWSEVVSWMIARPVVEY